LLGHADASCKEIRPVTLGAESSSAMEYSEAVLGRGMLAANDVAREGAIIQDGWASYASAPHRVLALPLMAPCIFDGGCTPECTHP
jgi:hypothetical protein